MSVNEFKVGQSRLVAELQLFIMDVRELGLDEDTTDLIVDRASKLIAVANDGEDEIDLDKVRRGLGDVQGTLHQALKRRNQNPR